MGNRECKSCGHSMPSCDCCNKGLTEEGIWMKETVRDRRVWEGLFCSVGCAAHFLWNNHSIENAEKTIAEEERSKGNEVGNNEFKIQVQGAGLLSEFIKRLQFVPERKEPESNVDRLLGSAGRAIRFLENILIGFPDKVASSCARQAIQDVENCIEAVKKERG